MSVIKPVTRKEYNDLINSYKQSYKSDLNDLNERLNTTRHEAKSRYKKGIKNLEKSKDDNIRKLVGELEKFETLSPEEKINQQGAYEARLKEIKEYRDTAYKEWQQAIADYNQQHITEEKLNEKKDNYDQLDNFCKGIQHNREYSDAKNNYQAAVETYKATHKISDTYGQQVLNGLRNGFSSSTQPYFNQTFYRDLAAAFTGRPTGNELDASQEEAKAHAIHDRQSGAETGKQMQRANQEGNRNKFVESEKMAAQATHYKDEQNLANKEGLSGAAAALERTVSEPDAATQQTYAADQRKHADERQKDKYIYEGAAINQEANAVRAGVNSRNYDMDTDKEYYLNNPPDTPQPKTETQPTTPTETQPTTPTETPAKPELDNGASIIYTSGQNIINKMHEDLHCFEDEGVNLKVRWPAIKGEDENYTIGDKTYVGEDDWDDDAEAQVEYWAKHYEPLYLQYLIDKGKANTEEEAKEIAKDQNGIGSSYTIADFLGRPGENARDWYLDGEGKAKLLPSDYRVKDIKGMAYDDFDYKGSLERVRRELSDTRMKIIQSEMAKYGRPQDYNDFEYLLKKAGKMKYKDKEYDTDSESLGDESVLRAYADHVRNFIYNYKPEAQDIDPSIDPNEEHIGPMAQDIEQVNPACVKETSEGVKTVDTSRLALMNAGAIGDLARELQDIASRLSALGV